LNADDELVDVSLAGLAAAATIAWATDSFDGGGVDVVLSSLPQPARVASTRAAAAHRFVENFIRCSCFFASCDPAQPAASGEFGASGIRRRLVQRIAANPSAARAGTTVRPEPTTSPKPSRRRPHSPSKTPKMQPAGHPARFALCAGFD